VRDYLAHLEHTNLSEAQKIELLQTLWSIMSTFVDLAFGTDSVPTRPPAAIDTGAGDATAPAGKSARSR